MAAMKAIKPQRDFGTAPGLPRPKCARMIRQRLLIETINHSQGARSITGVFCALMSISVFSADLLTNRKSQNEPNCSAGCQPLPAAHRLQRRRNREHEENASTEDRRFSLSDVTGDGVSYFSEMIEGPAERQKTRCRGFHEGRVTDRTYYPLPPAVEANCGSGTDPREMAMKALGARETAMQNGNAFAR